MPRDTVINVTDTWTQLTANDVTSITFVNLGQPRIHVRVTSGATAPAEALGIPYAVDQGERLVPLSELAAGVTGGNRVWAKTIKGTSKVLVSHA